MEKTNKKIWQWAVSIILPLLICLIPLSDVYTAQLRIFFIVTLFAILLVAFDLVDSLIAAVVLFMGYYATGIVDAATVFSSWSNDVAWMIIGSLVFAAALNETGIMKRFAYSLILKLGGSYTKMLWAIYFVGVIISVLTSCNGFPLLAAIAFAICKGLGYSLGSKESNGIALAAMAGSVCPFAWLYNPINAGVGDAVLKLINPDLSITWVSYLQISWPWFAFDLLWMILLTKVFFRSTGAGVKTEFFANELGKLGKITNAEKKALVLTVIIVLYMIIASFTGWKTAYGFSLIAWVVFLPGINLANSDTLKKVNFGVVFFTVACITIGSVGNALGVGELINTLVGPMLEHVSNIGFVGGVWGISTVANFLLTPVACSTVLGVPLMQIGASLGVDPVATLFTIMMNTSNVFMPHENTAYLLFFAFGLMMMKDFIKYNAIRMVGHLVFMMAIIVPYWFLIGIL